MDKAATLKPNQFQNGRKIYIAVLVAIAIALFFWSQSRVPALNQKAAMGERTIVGSLGFDIVLPVEDAFPWYQRIANTAVNWGYTNWKGMTFGLLFAAAIFVLLNYLPRQQFKSRFLNALKGVIAGAPLGVCVNCVTPIAHGMYKAGVRMETVLATLVSSPTLNVIVLSMTFSLLPFHLALAKLLGVLFLVLLVIPLLSRMENVEINDRIQNDIEKDLENSFYQKSVIGNSKAAKSGCTLPDLKTNTLLQDLLEVVFDYSRALFFVIRTTLPFMLLAGLLGATVIELLPVEQLAELKISLLGALLVGALGAFLPVPISFDVVIVSLLISSGVPTLFSTILLFTLGSYSVYPFLVLWRNMSLKIASSMFICVVAVGLICGYLVQKYELSTAESAINAFNEIVESNNGGEFGSEEQDLVAVKQHIALAQKICTNYDNTPLGLTCLTDFIFSEFQNNKTELLCKAWPADNQTGVRDFCFSEYKDLISLEGAIDSRNPERCANLSSDQKKANCYQEVALRKVRIGLPLSVCYELEGESAVNECLQKGITIRLDKFNDASSCAELKDLNQQQQCAKNVKIQQIATGRDFSACDALDSPRGVLDCKRIIAFNMIDDGADASVCDRLTDSMEQLGCKSHAVITRAAEFGKPEQCASIEIPQLRTICTRVAVNRKIGLEIDLADAGRLNAHLHQQENPVMPQSKPGIIEDPSEGGLELLPLANKDNLRIEYIPFRKKIGQGQGFEKRWGYDFGIEDPWDFSFLEFVSPFWGGRGIAAGDVNNDNWPDLLLASNDGLHLYLNHRGIDFIHKKLNLNDPLTNDTFLAALVDLNNDGLLDILATSYGGKVTVLNNDGNDFNRSEPEEIPNTGANLAISAGFADVDRDGDLDILLGNWSFGEDKAFLENYSGNRLVINDSGVWRESSLVEVSGDSLSVLFSDWSGDGFLDLIVGNDREIPDNVYLGSNEGYFSRLTRSEKVIPATSLNTMSVESADFNNDLLLDLFSTDMSFADGKSRDYCDGIDDKSKRSRCEYLLDGRNHIERRDNSWCQDQSGKDKTACLTAIFRNVAIKSKRSDLCQKIPENQAAHGLYCLNLIRKDIRQSSFSVAKELKQSQSNILLIANQNGGFTDSTKELGVGRSFWSWNAKAADLDNDQWQDIYVGNGFRFGEGDRVIHSNVFYHNRKGKAFEISEEKFGLTDYINTPSYVYLDFDLDGDLDIISTGLLAPLRVFVNRESTNNAISFRFRDSVGNYNGIGNKVIIYYGPAGDGHHQIRELKASGGFMSFDQTEAFFGLAEYDNISKAEILWSTGEKTSLDGPLAANRQYIISRTNASIAGTDTGK